MNFHIRKWVRPEDLNPNGSMFGGRLLAWIDEEAAIYANLQLDSFRIVTKFISEINFVGNARQGDILELGMEVADFGTTSLTFKCEVRNKASHERILTVDKIVFVNLDENGNALPHGKTEVQPIKDEYHDHEK